MHLAGVHRGVRAIIGERLQGLPDPAGFVKQLPADTTGWPDPADAPNRGPMPAGLLDWFAESAADLESLFAATDPAQPAWTYGQDRTAGFWMRVQTIEAAVHRWDAENALGTARPLHADGPCDVELSGTASQLALFLWQRAPAGELTVTGDRDVLDRYFTLVPPV